MTSLTSAKRLESVTGIGLDVVAAAAGADPAIEQRLRALASVMEPVDVHFRWRPQLADPSDELVLEAAVNGRADAIITHNIRDLSPATKRFRLQVLRPAELLERFKV